MRRLKLHLVILCGLMFYIGYLWGCNSTKVVTVDAEDNLYYEIDDGCYGILSEDTGGIVSVELDSDYIVTTSKGDIPIYELGAYSFGVGDWVNISGVTIELSDLIESVNYYSSTWSSSSDTEESINTSIEGYHAVFLYFKATNDLDVSIDTGISGECSVDNVLISPDSYILPSFQSYSYLSSWFTAKTISAGYSKLYYTMYCNVKDTSTVNYTMILDTITYNNEAVELLWIN